MGSVGWHCLKCTFYHKNPSQRCMVCNALRVPKKGTMDIVAGKGDKSSWRDDEVESGSFKNGNGINKNCNLSRPGSNNAPITVNINDDSTSMETSSGRSSNEVQRRPLHEMFGANNIPVEANIGNSSTESNNKRLNVAPPKTLVSPYARQSQSAPASTPQTKSSNEKGIDRNSVVSTNGINGQRHPQVHSEGLQNPPQRKDHTTEVKQPIRYNFFSTKKTQTPIENLENSILHQPKSNSHSSGNNNKAETNFVAHSLINPQYNCPNNAFNNSASESQIQAQSQHHTKRTTITDTKYREINESQLSMQQTANKLNFAQSILSKNMSTPLNVDVIAISNQPTQPILQSDFNATSTAASTCPPNGYVGTPVVTKEICTSHNLQYQEGPVPLCPHMRNTWIYPIDEKYPERIYQLEMSQSSIMSNTLVSLPTGLGKTLIAAVVMYNFYRWFPDGKVVFCAPTRPLVTQQIQACYKIMGIPEHETAEISGKSKPDNRTRMWANKSVFFCTPHTIVKDIENGRCDARSIVCVVLDEAHRATGSHPSAVLVKKIEEAGAKFRLVGLSATPGTDIKGIQRVIENLRISKIEVRTEEDPDVKQYIHSREEEIIIIKQPDIVLDLNHQIGEIMMPLIERLRHERVVIYGGTNVTPYNCVDARRRYIADTGDHRLNGFFEALYELAQVRGLLRTHGATVAKKKLEDMVHNGRNGLMGKIMESPGFRSFWNNVLKATGCAKEMDHEAAKDLQLNNPKYSKLAELLVDHFQQKQALNESTRAIVFSQWRDSVEGIVEMLSSQNPSLLKPTPFIGQSRKSSSKKGKKSGNTSSGTSEQKAGMNQAQQQKVLNQFSKGIFNILVCTCVGEEGLDIGEVDLIVNFDVLKSPIRSIQRSGRTGRKRDGRVIFLVAEGQEQKNFRDSMTNTKKIARALLKPDVFELCLDFPLFPSQPDILRQKMTKTNFHMSQVGGHTPKVRRRRALGTEQVSEATVIDTGWKLSTAQEEERKKLFGQLPTTSSSELASCKFPEYLRRKFLKLRHSSHATKLSLGSDQQIEDIPALPCGRSSAILINFEEMYMVKSISSTTVEDEPTVTANRCTVCEVKKITDDSSKTPKLGDDGASMHIVEDSSENSLRCSERENNEPKGERIFNLDTVFGLTDVEQSGNVSLKHIGSLFDSINHRYCSVIAPSSCGALHFFQDECLSSNVSSDEVSTSESSEESQVSGNMMNVDLPCEYFEPDVSKSDAINPCEQLSTIIRKFGDSQIEAGNNDSKIETNAAIELDASENSADLNNDSASDVNLEHQNPEMHIKPCANLTPSKAFIQNDNSDMVEGNSHTSKSDTPFHTEDECNILQACSDCGDSFSNTDEIETFTPKTNNAIVIGKDCAEPNENHFSPAKQRTLASGTKSQQPPESSVEINDAPNTFTDKRPNNIQSNAAEAGGKFNNSGISVVKHSSHASHLVDSQTFSGRESSTKKPLDDLSSLEKKKTPEDQAGGLSVGRRKCTKDQNNVFHPKSKDVGVMKPAQRSSSSDNSGNNDGNQLANDARPKLLQQTPSDDTSNRNDSDVDISQVKTCGNVEQDETLMAPINTQNEEDLSKDLCLTDTPETSRNSLKATPCAQDLDNLTDTPHDANVKKQGRHLKRLRQTAPTENAQESLTDEEHVQRQDRVKKRIEEKYRCRFLDTEAAVDDSVDSSEEDALNQIEEDEKSHNSFINDSSQLGYTQDDLDRVNADSEVLECENDDTLHRQLDHQRNVDNQFKTPIFNRKMRNVQNLSQSSPEPSSQKGLGNMHFIRSVLEHHRQGGEAHELEEDYRQLVGQSLSDNTPQKNDEKAVGDFPVPSQPLISEPPPSAPSNSNQPISRASQQIPLEPKQPINNEKNPSNDDTSKVVVTAEQRARMEAKRLEALKRRQQRMQQQQAIIPINPYAK